MGVYMSPEELKAAARAHHTNTAEALKAAEEAVTSLVALRENRIFGLSPAGQQTGMVFTKASTVIDELIAEVTKAITVLTQNLHLSANLVVKNQEDARIDFDKLARDNRNHVTVLDVTGIKPGERVYQDPTAGPQDPGMEAAGPRDGNPGEASTPATTPVGQQPTGEHSGN